MNDGKQVKTDEAFMEKCREAAMKCIESGNDTNAQRASYMLNYSKSFSSFFVNVIKEIIGRAAINFTNNYNDNVFRMRKKLDFYDDIYNRDNGDSIL